MTFQSKHRRSFIALIASVIAVAAGVGIASAAVLLEDHFSYPTGNLVGNGGWVNHSGTGTFIQVNATKSVDLTNGSGSREDANRPFALRGAAAKTYASFTLSVPSTAALGAFDYFAHFRPAPTTTNFKARVHSGVSTVGGNYAVGISATTATTTPVVSWPTGLIFDQVYFVVIAWDAATGTAEMWVDPANENSPKISSTDAGSIGETLQDFAWRQGTNGASAQTVDNLRVGDTFDDVTPPPPLPSTSTWGLAALALLVAGAGTLFVVRRRNAVA
jgi:hypothetical protein